LGVRLSDAPRHPAADAPDDAARDDTREPERSNRWLCVACRAPVTSDDALFALPGRPEVEVHVNPAGLAFRVMTVRVATVVVSGPAFPAFTWYPGHAWRLATCPGCQGHLGWRYDRVVDEPAPGFYGLIVDRLTHE
jgi:hypothetical protein